MMGSNIPTDMKQSPDRMTDHVTDHTTDTTVRDTVADLMPWMATILLHAAMVLIAILFVWATLERDPVEDPYVAPTICATLERPEPLAKLKETTYKQSSGDIRNVSTAVTRTRTLESFDTSKVITLGPIGHSSPESRVFTGPTGGSGDGIFDAPEMQGPGAHSFVFVIDASGSMIDTLPFVVAELKRTIRSLSERHTFSVIFYQGDQIIQSPGGTLKYATPENIKLAFEWLDGESLSPSGLSDPMTAIERGLHLKPQVLFLLSDNITGSGRYEINQSFLLKRIANANIGKTKINTIQFLYPDPLTRIPGMKPTLERISEESGGRYRFLSAKDLGL